MAAGAQAGAVAAAACAAAGAAGSVARGLLSVVAGAWSLSLLAGEAITLGVLVWWLVVLSLSLSQTSAHGSLDRTRATGESHIRELRGEANGGVEHVRMISFMC